MTGAPTEFSRGEAARRTGAGSKTSTGGPPSRASSAIAGRAPVEYSEFSPRS